MKTYIELLNEFWVIQKDIVDYFLDILKNNQQYISVLLNNDKDEISVYYDIISDMYIIKHISMNDEYEPRDLIVDEYDFIIKYSQYMINHFTPDTDTLPYFKRIG